MDRDVSMQVYLLDAMQDAMRAGGYGPRSRSAWLEEALIGMLIHDPIMLEGSVGDKAVAGPLGKLLRIKVRLHRPMALQLEALSRRLRREDPFREGPMSYVMRSAARFRLRFPKLCECDYESADARLQQAMAVDFSAP